MNTDRNIKMRYLLFCSGMVVLLGGCASLDTRLVSDKALVRNKAEQELRGMPASRRDEHVVALVRRLYGSTDRSGGKSAGPAALCKDRFTPSDANILNSLKDLGPAASVAVPDLSHIFSQCRTPGLRESINKALLSIAGLQIKE